MLSIFNIRLEGFEYKLVIIKNNLFNLTTAKLNFEVSDSNFIIWINGIVVKRVNF